MQEKKTTKCPVCGKFASEKYIEKYNQLMSKLIYSEDAVEDLQKANASIVKKCGELINENRRLKNRGFWARVFNL